MGVVRHEKDPHEMNNVYGDPKNVAVVDQLKKEITRLRGVYGDND